MAMNPATTELVDTAERLSALCEQWRRQSCLAVDTEFVRTDTFYPILGLIQVSDGENCWLLDPIALGNLEPFTAILSNDSVLKIFHACSEDLEVLRHHLGVVPAPIFDTQVAAAYAGFGFSRGYSTLVSEVTRTELEKHETRSDWLQRPLTEAQFLYAAEDVFYLVRVYDYLESCLKETGKWTWVTDDMQVLAEKSMVEQDPADYYLKIKSAWQLPRDSLAILKALAIWRESEARAKNKPRSRIVSDRVLWEIARNKPRDLSQLSRLPDVHPRVRRQYGSQLLSLIAEVENSDPDAWPLCLPQPLPRAAGSTLKKLRAALGDIADRLNVAREVLARKQDLETIAGSALGGEARLPLEWRGSWRETVLGETLLAAAKS